MKNDYPIGLFDSGIGGTSIWHEIHSILPNENTIYLADSKNAPYGQKSKDEIIHLSEKNVEFLLNRNSKIIVVACNTATTNAIDFLREKYDVPFIGIESGKINSEETENLLKEYILPMVDKDIDHLVLGCTHYPYLTPIIKQFIPNEVKIIDSGEAVAKQTKNILEKLNLLNQTQGKVTNEFFINTDAKVLKTFLPGIDSVFELDF